MNKLREGILTVSSSVLKDGITAQEVGETIALSRWEEEVTNLNEEDLMAGVQSMEKQVGPEGV